MDKTITIDGQPVVFRKTAGTAHRYQTQFGRELNADLLKLYELQTRMKKCKSKDDQIRAYMGAETEWVYDVLFIMAQQADSTITDVDTWLDRFDSLDVWAVLNELYPMLIAEARPSPKNA